MTNRGVYIISTLAMLLIGCASGEIVQTDDDKYRISKKSPQVGFGPPVEARAEAYQAANDFCAKQNKRVETINLELTHAGFSRTAAATLEFRCKAGE